MCSNVINYIWNSNKLAVHKTNSKIIGRTNRSIATRYWRILLHCTTDRVITRHSPPQRLLCRVAGIQVFRWSRMDESNNFDGRCSLVNCQKTVDKRQLLIIIKHGNMISGPTGYHKSQQQQQQQSRIRLIYVAAISETSRVDYRYQTTTI